KHENKKKSIVLPLLIVISSLFTTDNIYAFDIKKTSINEAFESGKYAFIGFVNNSAVISRGKGQIKARANISIDQCLIGKTCEKGGNFIMDYFTEVVIDPILPVKFSVGDEILLILKTTPVQNTPHFFDSNFDNTTDHLYICHAFPYSILDKASSYKCTDAITGNKTKQLNISHILARTFHK
ncbi:MAG: hypothetical protein D6B27_05320, partial [Gammaproteobacteria bacterium]